MANIVDFANQIKTYMRGAEVVPSKNKYRNTCKSGSSNAINYTVNSDLSVTLGAGTASPGNAYLSDWDNRFTLPVGTYKLSGCPSGGSTSTYMIMLQDTTASPNVNYYDTGDGVEFEVTDSTHLWCMYIGRVIVGTNIPSLTFYPMITLASETDQTYMPYFEPLKDRVDELTDYNTGFNFLKFLYNSDGDTIYTGDLNNLYSGYVYFSSSATNIPSSVFGFCLTIDRPAAHNYSVQIAFSATSDGCWYRRKNNGTWQAWKEITLAS